MMNRSLAALALLDARRHYSLLGGPVLSRALAVLAVSLWLIASAPAGAQSQYQFTATFETHEKLPGEVEKLRQLAAQKAWEAWIGVYQELIDEHPDAVLPQGEERLVGLRATLHAMLTELPDAARQAYRRKYDPIARGQWEKARALEDPEAMRQVHLRYRHSRYGPRALRWLADRALDRGEYEIARLAYARLAEEERLQPGWATEEETAWLLLRWGMASTLAGRATEAGEAFDMLTRKHGSRELVVRGVPRRVTQIVAEEREQLRPEAKLEGWPQFAGAPAGARRMVFSVGAALLEAQGPSLTDGEAEQPGAAALARLWTATSTGVLRDRALRLDAGPWGAAVVRPGGTSLFHFLAFPIVGDNRVYLQTPSGARAVDLGDGRILWTNSDLSSTRGSGTVQRRYYGYYRAMRNLQLAPALAGPYLILRAPVGMGDGFSDGRWPVEFALAALDTRTGREVWTRLAGGNPAGSFFNLPTVHTRTIYSGIASPVAGLTEYRAVAVDAGTGERRWTAYLGTGSDPMATADGSPPAVADGVVWVESSLHTLNALDAVTGELLWIYRYQPRPVPYYRSGWQDRMTLPNEPISLIAPVGGRVLFAPRWGDQCVALEGRTGRLLWSAPRGDSRSLFAVDEARVYLCGSEVHALDLNTGARRWSWTAPDARAGYAALAGNRVYVPVGSTLYVLDRATGRQLARVDLGLHGVEPEYGALLMLSDRILLSQPERLFAFGAAEAAAAQTPTE